MNLTAYVPDSTTCSGKEIKQIALAAINEGLSVQRLPAGTLRRVSVYLNTKEQLEFINGVTRAQEIEPKLSKGRILGGYFLAKIRGGGIAASVPAMTVFSRPDQERFYQQIVGRLAPGRIVLAEAATGIGKGRALVRTALEKAQEGKQRVVIAVPTVQTVQQTLYEYTKWLETIEEEGCLVTALLGRGNFFDPEIAVNLLQDPETMLPEEQRQEVLVWIAGGAKPLPGGSGEHLETYIPGIGYLLDDLLEWVPQWAGLGGLRLTTKPQDEEAPGESVCPATRIYNMLREDAQNAELVLCTHAMLGHDIRMRRFSDGAKSILGEFDVLFLDEAHLLEATLRHIETFTFSPIIAKSMLRHMDGATKSSKDKAIRACQRLIDLGGSMDGEGWSFMPQDWREPKQIPSLARQAFDRLEDVGKALAAVVRAKNRNGGPPQRLVDALQTVRQIVGRRNPTMIQISPIRRWISMGTGPVSVAGHFKRLWDDLDSAVLVSATLSLPSTWGPDYRYLSRKMALPASRVGPADPIWPSWVTSPVVLHIPKGPSAFEPPMEKSVGVDVDTLENSQKQWIDRLGEQIVTIAEGSQGGVLVLCTSYETAAALSLYLENQMRDSSRILQQQRHLPFGALRKDFLERSRGGTRPVWVGVGQAWTGVDLSETNSDRVDDLLTDLVITRIPFRSKNTLVRGQGGSSEAAFTFRQGIGRLVRRPDCRIKHLWVMDGRIWGEKRKFYKVFREILKPYTVGCSF